MTTPNNNPPPTEDQNELPHGGESGLLSCSLASLISKFEAQATLSEGKAGWVETRKGEPEISFHTLHIEKSAVWQFCADCLKEISQENDESLPPADTTEKR